MMMVCRSGLTRANNIDGFAYKLRCLRVDADSARSFRISEATAALAKLGDVCSVPVVTRNAYQDALGIGLGVVEFEPKGKAAEESERLWKWIQRKLK